MSFDHTSRMKHTYLALIALVALLSCKKEPIGRSCQPQTIVHTITTTDTVWQSLYHTKWAKPDDTLTFYADSVYVQLWGIDTTYLYYTYHDTLIVEKNKYQYRIDAGRLYLNNGSVTSVFTQLRM